MVFLLLGAAIGIVGIFLISWYIWEYKSLIGNLEHSNDDIGKFNRDVALNDFYEHKSKGGLVIPMSLILLVVAFFTIW